MFVNVAIKVICSRESALSANSSWTFTNCSWTNVYKILSSKTRSFLHFADLSKPPYSAAQCNPINTFNACLMWGAMSILTMQKWSVLWRHLSSDVIQHPDISLIPNLPNCCKMCSCFTSNVYVEWFTSNVLRFSLNSMHNDVLFRYFARIFVTFSIPEADNVAIFVKIFRRQTGGPDWH